MSVSSAATTGRHLGWRVVLGSEGRSYTGGYHPPDNTQLHTVTRWHYSRDHRLVLGLAWLPPTAHTANQFLHRVHQLMDCPENVGLSGPR